MPLFSVITVCRNNISGLIETYESLKLQTFNDFEWIVVDGDSTDGTVEWLNNIDFPFKWISEKDKGIYDAMNKGIRLSNGNFLIFMNSGDVFADESVLAKIHANLEIKGNKPLFVYGDSWDVDEKGNSFYRKAKDYKFIYRGMITQHQAIFINFAKMPDLNFSEQYQLTADYAMICEVIKRCKPADILKVEFAICKFRMGGTNESSRFKALKEDYQIRRKILQISVLQADVLYLLHYVHTVLKKIIPYIRFLKHSNKVKK